MGHGVDGYKVYWAYVDSELWKTLSCLGAPKVQTHDFGFKWEGLRENCFILTISFTNQLRYSGTNQKPKADQAISRSQKPKDDQTKTVTFRPRAVCPFIVEKRIFHFQAHTGKQDEKAEGALPKMESCYET